MAGPCSVESREQTMELAGIAARPGRAHPARRRLQAAHLALRLPGHGRERAADPGRRARRGSAWRSSPRSWARRTCDLVAEYADMLQIGARNMQNYRLLEAVGQPAQAGAAEARHEQRPSKNCCWPPSTSWPQGNRNVDALRARHPHLRDAPRATPSTSTPSRCSSCSPTCRSSPTPATAPGAGTWWRRMARAAIAAGADGLIDRGAPAPGGGALRRRAVAASRAVGGADRRAEPRQRRHRPRALHRAHRGARMTAAGLSAEDVVRIVGPARLFGGRAEAPGDKSISHRAALFGAVAHGETHIRGFLPANDCSGLAGRSARARRAGECHAGGSGGGRRRPGGPRGAGARAVLRRLRHDDAAAGRVDSRPAVLHDPRRQRAVAPAAHGPCGRPAAPHGRDHPGAAGGIVGPAQHPGRELARH